MKPAHSDRNINRSLLCNNTRLPRHRNCASLYNNSSWRWTSASRSDVTEKPLVVLWQQPSSTLDVGPLLWRHRETARPCLTTTVFDVGRRPVTVTWQRNCASLCDNNSPQRWTLASHCDVTGKSLVCLWQLVFTLDVSQSLWRHTETARRSVTTTVFHPGRWTVTLTSQSNRSSLCDNSSSRWTSASHYDVTEQPLVTLWLQHSHVNYLIR